MYEKEVSEYREEELKKWKVRRLVLLEDDKENYLEKYDKEKAKIIATKVMPDTSGLTFSGGSLTYSN